jgi:hypothetical protein
MIVSHLRKFVFLKSRKTAGTSLEIALSRYCGPDDVLTPINTDEPLRLELTGKRPQHYARPLASLSPRQMYRHLVKGRKVEVFTEHMTAVAARQRLGPRIWDEYFKFTIVRNPFDRMLSRYFWSMQVRPGNRDVYGIETLDQFLRYRPECVNENWLIYTQGDRLLVDDVVRFERLEDDLARISERIGLDHNLYEDMKPIRAKSDFRPANGGRQTERGMIGPAEAEIIRSLCAKEIETFNYSVPELAEAELPRGAHG